MREDTFIILYYSQSTIKPLSVCLDLKKSTSSIVPYGSYLTLYEDTLKHVSDSENISNYIIIMVSCNPRVWCQSSCFFFEDIISSIYRGDLFVHLLSPLLLYNIIVDDI